MEGTDMNSMPSLTLTERIAEVCASLISELGEKPLDKDAVSQRCEGVSLSNAQKNLASLMNLGILDQEKRPTALGIRWANPSLRQEATREVISVSFPEGMSAFSSKSENKDIVPWLKQHGSVSEEVAKKNAAAFRALLHFAEIGGSVEDAEKHAPLPIPAQRRRRITVNVPLKASDTEIQRIINFARANDLDIVMY